jgi:hypothetical protein
MTQISQETEMFSERYRLWKVWLRLGFQGKTLDVAAGG